MVKEAHDTPSSPLEFNQLRFACIRTDAPYSGTLATPLVAFNCNLDQKRIEFLQLKTHFPEYLILPDTMFKLEQSDKNQNDDKIPH